MQSISASELLDIWEKGSAKGPIQRAIFLLIVAFPEKPTIELANLCIGERDAHLLALREYIFGPMLNGSAVCPKCGEKIEFDVDVDALKEASSAKSSIDLSMECGEYKVYFRLPNTFDLEAVSVYREIDSARDNLLKRCLSKSYHNECEIPLDSLPIEVLDLVAADMSKLDPQGDLLFELSCPICGHKWQAIFDIVSFFWSEITAWAQRMLREVHVLASAYRWRESDILAMSAWRRQSYLEMLGT